MVTYKATRGGQVAVSGSSYTTSSGRTYSTGSGRAYLIGGPGATWTPATMAADIAARSQAKRLSEVERARQVLISSLGGRGLSGAALLRYQAQMETLEKQRAAVTAGTTLEKTAAAAREVRLREEAAAAVAVSTPCARGAWYNISFLQGCDPGYVKKFDFGRKMYYCECVSTPPTTPPAEPTPPTAGCPEGLFYDATWYQACKEGYVEYSLKGHNKCVCSAKMAEAKAQLDALYVKENGYGDGDGDGDGIFAGFEGIGNVTKYIPVLIIGAIVVAAIGMFKK